MHYVHLWHHLAIMLTGEATWTLESAQRADPSLVPQRGATICDTSGRHDQSTSGHKSTEVSQSFSSGRRGVIVPKVRGWLPSGVIKNAVTLSLWTSRLDEVAQAGCKFEAEAMAWPPAAELRTRGARRLRSGVGEPGLRVCRATYAGAVDDGLAFGSLRQVYRSSGGRGPTGRDQQGDGGTDPRPAAAVPGQAPKEGTVKANKVRPNVPIEMIPWDTTEPGHRETDLVHHCGNILVGTHVPTLQPIDIATGWSGRVAISGRGIHS
jgi:hypothetical protein